MKSQTDIYILCMLSRRNSSLKYICVSWTHTNCRWKWITITPNVRIQWTGYRQKVASKNKIIRFVSFQSPTPAFSFKESKLTLLIWSGLTMLVFEKNCRRFFISVITRSWPSSNIMMIACGKSTIKLRVSW